MYMYLQITIYSFIWVFYHLQTTDFTKSLWLVDGNASSVPGIAAMLPRSEVSLASSVCNLLVTRALTLNTSLFFSLNNCIIGLRPFT